MMSADQYRALAAGLVSTADRCGDYGLILELEAMAQQWRRLAEVADWQESVRAAVAASR